jgi:hypothetical protein
MSIFDAIKYPISFPPTEEELEALPHSLFRLWAAKVEFSKNATTTEVCLWYKFYGGTFSSQANDEVQLLREMISKLHV